MLITNEPGIIKIRNKKKGPFHFEAVVVPLKANIELSKSSVLKNDLKYGKMFKANSPIRINRKLNCFVLF